MDSPAVTPPRLRLAIVGAGPVGLTLALLLARRSPDIDVSVFDSRPLDHDVRADARTLAVSLGSVQLFERLHAWNAALAQPIHTVHVSQQPPTWTLPASLPWSRRDGGGDASVTLRAADLGCPMLGAVLPYGALVAPLQDAWETAAQGAAHRLHSHFGRAVAAVRATANGGARLECARTPTGAGASSAAVESTPAMSQPGVEPGLDFDVAVIAEGGVFAHQARKPLTHDYRQTAWVGTVLLAAGSNTAGVAIERFTRHGPVAMLPLADAPAGQPRAAIVWCVPSDDDPVRALNDSQRVAVLNTLFPALAGRITALAAPLKDFALGLNAVRTMVDRNGAIVRIGNAAQTLHPVAGQGLNLGLRDAHALAEALRRHDSIAAALKRVEWQRAPDRLALLAGTDFLARSFTWGLPGLGAARGLALTALDEIGPLKRALARRMMFGFR